MKHKEPRYKMLECSIDNEKYRTDTSTLLAYDEENSRFLFRAINSYYFVQNDKDGVINLLPALEAEKLWHQLPVKHVKDIVAAFPMMHGGIGMDTYTNLYDD